MLGLPGGAEEVRTWLGEDGVPTDGITPIEAALDSEWVRDYGPLQVKVEGEGVLWLDAEYFASRPLDDAVPELLGEAFGVPVEGLELAIEGGAIISNGEGLCASTLESFERAGLDVEDTEYLEDLLAQLGCHAWALVPALRRDPTAHVDMLAQFLSPKLVLVAEIDPEEDAADAARLEEAARGLRLAADAVGMELEIVRVPTGVHEDEVYFTYVNGMQLGSSFLVPSYQIVSPDAEARAYEVLESALEGVELVPIPADEFIELNGAIHCLTLGLVLPPLP